MPRTRNYMQKNCFCVLILLKVKCPRPCGWRDPSKLWSIEHAFLCWLSGKTDSAVCRSVMALFYSGQIRFGVVRSIILVGIRAAVFVPWYVISVYALCKAFIPDNSVLFLCSPCCLNPFRPFINFFPWEEVHFPNNPSTVRIILSAHFPFPYGDICPCLSLVF